VTERHANGTRSYGRYRLIAEVGRGRSGVVYKAEDPVIGRTVAIKVLREPLGLVPEDREAYRARLRSEAELAGALQHAHIMTLYDVGDDYVVMEFLEGRPLSAFVGHGRAFEPATAVRLGRQLALALDFAHARGIVHRAVKPASVMVLASGDLKIMDFGVPRLRLRGQRGAPLDPYEAPERQAGQRADARADVYSLGAVLYEMLAGEAPPTARRARSAADVAPRVGPHVQAVVGKALRPVPGERHASAGQLIAELEDALAAEDDPLSFLVTGSDAAAPPLGRPGRRPRARRVGFAAVVATAALLAAVSGALPVFRAREPAAQARPRGARAAAPVVASRPVVPTPVAVDRPEAPAAAPLETLLVSSTPSGARVFIDGAEKGTTPLAAQLAPGRSLVRVEKDGYAVAARLAWLGPGRSLGLSLPLDGTGERRAVDVLSLPDGGRLLIDGEPVGRTNALDLPLSHGFHVVEVHKQGFLPWVEEVEVGPSFDRVIATLVKAPGEEPGRAR
jgi:serine/threonine-protein kinase